MKTATGTTVIANGQLVDGTGRPPVRDAAVVIRDGRVSYAGPVAQAPAAPPDAVRIDARGGKVAVEGWAEVSDVAAVDLARRFEDAGVAAVVYTDIERDGAMAGPNVAATAALARAVGVPVIASGGVSSMADLRALKESGAPLDGAISGRALYEGRLDLAEAVAYLAA